jgi:hypothetical protein
MATLFRQDDQGTDAWRLAPWHEHDDGGAALRFDDVAGAITWLQGFDAAELRELLLSHGNALPLARLTDAQVREALARLLVDGTLRASSAASATGAADPRFADVPESGPAVRLVRRLKITGRPFGYDDERLRLVTVSQWRFLRDAGEARWEVVPHAHARPMVERLARWPTLGDDERRSLSEAPALLVDATAPPGSDGLVVLRHIARDAAIEPDHAEPAETPSQAAGRQKQELHWIEIVLVDDAGEPVAGEPYLLELPDGSVRNGALDKDGQAHIGELPTGGQCRVCFPQIDAREWRPA